MMIYPLSTSEEFGVFIEKLHQTAEEKYNGSIPKEFFSNICSNSVLQLDKQLLDMAQSRVNAFYKAFTEYEKKYPFSDTHEKKIHDIAAKNNSVLMAYDFHIDREGQLRLIEVNTNASGYPVVELLYKMHGLENLETENLDLLLNSFKEEANLGKIDTLRNMAIIDEDIENQKMYPEFLMFKNWFNKNGVSCEVINFDELVLNNESFELEDSSQNQYPFIYNRYCDFLLEEPRSNHLLQAYSRNKVLLSPHPKEYLKSADKHTLIRFSDPKILDSFDLNQNERESIERALIPTKPTLSFDKEELWSRRKNLFFKPSRSHGGKGTYRGKNISKKMFESVYSEDFICQELVPAPLCVSDGSDDEWKFDLRFYTYKNQIQQYIARIYKGQVTNFKEPEGGFTPIQWT